MPDNASKTRLIDETGKVYGHLTVVHRVTSGGPAARWLCRCACGADVEITGGRLRGDQREGWQTSHHGCPIIPNHRFVDLSGLVFGKFTVLHRSEGTADSSTYWLCRCACGVEVSVLSGSLRSGKSLGCTACGLLVGADKRRKYASREESAWRALYKAHRSRTEKYGCIEFLQWKVLVQQPCHYCQCDPADRGLVFAHGVDRKDSTLGYTPKNSVSCCFRCNKAKSVMSDADFIRMCREVARAHP